MDEPREERVLRRVIALLVLLAGVAERAAGRAFPVRFLVLLVLRRAEAVARSFAAGALLVDVICYDDDGACGPPDAATLALRFRALAAALSTLLAPAGLPRGRRDDLRRSLRRLARAGRAAAGRCVAFGVLLPRPNDTS